jgi:hypothetical protein
VFSGLVTPIYSMVPPALPYSQPVFKTVFGAAPNLAQAKSLLHQIGYVLYPSSIVARDWQ